MKEIIQRIKTKLEVVENVHDVGVLVKLPGRYAIKNKWCIIVTKYNDTYMHIIKKIKKSVNIL